MELSLLLGKHIASLLLILLAGVALVRLKVLKPEATYVLWADFTALGMSGEELHRFLIEEAKFCCDMGDEYSGPDTFVRICTAVPPQEVDRSLEIFREAVRRRKSGE